MPEISNTSISHVADRSVDTAWISQRGSRPPALQHLLNTIGNVFLADDVAPTAKFVAGKVFHNLSRPSGFYRIGGWSLHQSDHLDTALEAASVVEGPLAAVVSCLGELHSNLCWYRGETGPYASVNFVQDHAHSLLVGQGGIEERDDIELGLTVMGPFSRSPDHRRELPVAYLALSRGEVQVGDNDWASYFPGEIFFADEGDHVAMRCTRSPLLLLWCQRTQRRQQ
ncbi:hypothetical protein N185_37650 [Sinorhizobium sp. GW3]|nr:hypothetical protein N185_37650 [Sinorhizobium sp. GW3]